MIQTYCNLFFVRFFHLRLKQNLVQFNLHCTSTFTPVFTAFSKTTPIKIDASMLKKATFYAISDITKGDLISTAVSLHDKVKARHSKTPLS